MPAAPPSNTEIFNMTSQQPTVSEADRFLFDVQGYIILRGALNRDEVAELNEAVERLENHPFDDEGWMANALRPGGRAPDPTCDRRTTSQVRLNGLLRLDPAFHQLVGHPATRPYLEAFMERPQVGNTWTITKTKGAPTGGWHRGLQPVDYTVHQGQIRTRMLNVVHFLTPNGPEDGCMVAVPGSHKNDVPVPSGEAYAGLKMPGCVAITGEPGDVLLFTEALLHTGIPKTTEGRRTNIYFNHVSLNFNVMTYSPQHNRHFCMPQSVVKQMTAEQQEMLSWMQHFKPVEAVHEMSDA